MPRLKRRPKPRRQGLTAHQLEFLLTGIGFMGADFDGDTGVAREAWATVRDVLLPWFVARHPGCRPFAWWELSEPRERRERTDGKPHPFDNERRRTYVERIGKHHPAYVEDAYRLHFGTPNCLIAYDNRDGGECDDFIGEYETQAEYLRRLNLLTPEESKALDGLTPAELENIEADARSPAIAVGRSTRTAPEFLSCIGL